MQKNILCFGDSNTYGANPNNMKRWARSERWTGILQEILGEDYYIIEDGLSGRTTCFDDPLTPDRNGVKVLPYHLETHAPLDLVIIMLGTNDTKSLFCASAKTIAMGAGKVVEAAKNYIYLEGFRRPEILLVSPIHIEEGVEIYSGCDTFEVSSHEKSLELAQLYKKEAERLKVHFFDASAVAAPGCDRVHMDKKDHKAFAEAISAKVREILS